LESIRGQGVGEGIHTGEVISEPGDSSQGRKAAASRRTPKGRSKLRHYKAKNRTASEGRPYKKRPPQKAAATLYGTRSLRARGTMRNSTGRRARGSPSICA
jgi:hypothetical protein